jgi:hypothetical protein
MPLTDDDIKELSKIAVTSDAQESFKKAVSAFLRQQQAFSRSLQNCSEYTQRIWESVQAVPSVVGATPEETVKKQLDSLRRRVIPRLRELHVAVEYLSDDPVFQYLEPSHELRTVRQYKPKKMQERFIEQVTRFRDATGTVFRLNEISALIPEQATQSFERCVGAMSGDNWRKFLAWKVPAVEIQGVKLGPYYGVVKVSMVRAKSRNDGSLPFVFPAAGAKLVRYSNGWYWHPHVNASGNVCFGNMSAPMDTLMRAGDYWTAADLLDSILESWNPSSPYCALGLFEDGAQKMQWLCACGRSVKGAEPKNERTGVSFASCTSCAADVCSKCVQFCTQCASGALCRSCQMKLAKLDTTTGQMRPFGPICPECFEDLVADANNYQPFEQETMLNVPAP